MNQEKDPLDALLQEQNHYVADDGFTSRVMAALPKRRAWQLRHLFLLGVSTIGWILAILWLPWGDLPPLDSTRLLSLDSQALLPWITAFAVIACLVWSTLASIQWED